MNKDDSSRRHELWALFRFAVVGPLLASPPEHGELAAALRELSRRTWEHPITGKPVRFGASTIERWLYQARSSPDPVGVLRRKVRKDQGRQPSMKEALRRRLCAQYREHKSWSMRLHVDNLAVVVEREPELGPMPSYSTVVRYMKSHDLIRRRRRGRAGSPGAARAEARFEAREVRSFEAAHTNALWHLDFHHGSRKVLLADGTWTKPLVLGILDDRSRLCCHAQWYLAETASELIHGLCQAFQKRGLPRQLLSDNGSAMCAAETEQGLSRLGILHPTTLPYSPEQNGKQESFWGQVEGRLLAMLEGVEDLSLPLLNETTQAWLEMEYNRKPHSETGEAPIHRHLSGKDVGRESPSSEALRLAFTAEVTRTQRRSDGTLSLEGIRFEVPSRYRHLRTVRVRYASFDLGFVHLVDGHTGKVLCRLYPLDKTANASGERRALEPLVPVVPDGEPEPPSGGMAPLLEKLLADYAATGLPPAYLPKEIR